jgi:hypothetical protein
MKNQKPENSLVMTWLKQEQAPNDEESGEHVSRLDSQTSESEPDLSGKDVKSVEKRDL